MDAKSLVIGYVTRDFAVEAMGLEPTNLLTASQALYQLSYAPVQGDTISGWG